MKTLLTLSFTTFLFIGCFEKKSNPVEPTEPKVTETIVFQKDTLVRQRKYIENNGQKYSYDTLGFIDISNYDSLKITGHYVSTHGFRIDFIFNNDYSTIYTNIIDANNHNDTTFCMIKNLQQKIIGNNTLFSIKTFGEQKEDFGNLYYLYNLKLYGYKTE